jgi:hypothetical protein
MYEYCNQYLMYKEQKVKIRKVIYPLYVNTRVIHERAIDLNICIYLFIYLFIYCT